MKVCILAHRFYDGNVHMMQFANALARRGDQVDVISLRRKGLHAREVLDNVCVYRIQEREFDEKGPLAHLLRMSKFLIRSGLLLTKLHLRHRYQVIHIQSVPDFLVFAALIPKLLGASVILDMRDLTPELYASKFHVPSNSMGVRASLLSEKLAARFADHIIVANPIWLERIQSRSASKSKSSMFWYWPDPALFYPRAKRKQDGKFIILYPGTMNPHQGLDVALRAFAKLLVKIPSAEFHIYGEGPEKPRLRAIADELGIAKSVRIEKAVSAQEVAQLMAESDVGIVPKRASSLFGNEAASTKIWEFLALGVPVIASRTKVEVLLLGDSTVRFFQSENEDELADAIFSLYSDPLLKETMVKRGIEFINRRQWATEMSRYLAVVDKLALKNSSMPSRSDLALPQTTTEGEPQRPRY